MLYHIDFTIPSLNVCDELVVTFVVWRETLSYDLWVVSQNWGYSYMGQKDFNFEIVRTSILIQEIKFVFIGIVTVSSIHLANKINIWGISSTHTKHLQEAMNECDITSILMFSFQIECSNIFSQQWYYFWKEMALISFINSNSNKCTVCLSFPWLLKG